MISIVIPIYNRHDMTIDCINTIREHTQEFELVLVDNGSDPPFKPPFTGFNETVLIRNDSNRGFPVAVNQGIKASSGDVIILLNNDVVVTPEWSERLVGWLGEYSIAGPLTNYCAGLQRVKTSFYDNQDDLNRVAEEISIEYEGYSINATFTIGFCMAFKKSLYNEIGPLDESLWPCSGEEIDFCLKAVKAGHKVGIAHDVYVHHYGSQTFQDMQKSGTINYNEIVGRNDKHLAERWGKDFWLKQEVVNEETARDPEYHI